MDNPPDCGHFCGQSLKYYKSTSLFEFKSYIAVLLIFLLTFTWLREGTSSFPRLRPLFVRTTVCTECITFPGINDTQIFNIHI